MPYYPLSQIKTNLYTNGGEYIVMSTKENYTGYYWTTSQSRYFTGKTPNETPTSELIKLPDTRDSTESFPLVQNTDLTKSDFPGNVPYISLTANKEPQSKVRLPSYSANSPKDQDYKNGKFTRYFCKKINEFIYLEIDKITYDLLIKNDPQMLYQLYIPFSIPWVLTGDKTQVYTTNKKVTDLISSEKKLFMFDKYLNESYTKYYKEDIY